MGIRTLLGSLFRRKQNIGIIEQLNHAYWKAEQRLLQTRFVVKGRTMGPDGIYGDFVEYLNIDAQTAYDMAKSAQEEDLQVFNALNFGDTQLKFGVIVSE